MSVDVLASLQSFETSNNTAIDITPAIASVFGAAIGTAIANIFSGSIKVNGASYSLTGTSATATVSGTGSAPPLLQQFQVSLTFTASGSAATLVFTGSIQAAIPLSDAWPSALNEFPFNELTLSAGTASLSVNPNATSFSLSISATTSFEGSPLGTGLLEVSYDGTTLGFLGGFIVTSGSGNWTPFAHWPVLQNLSLSGEAGAFFSTITETDLSAFKTLNLPYLPDQIAPGLTFIASLTLAGSLAPISSILPSGTTLDLLANVPSGGVSQASVTAELTEPATNHSFELEDLKLVWQSTSVDSGSISISVTAGFNDGSQSVAMLGDVTFVYGTTPSMEGSISATGTGSWTHPFGVQNLTIESFSLGFSLAEDGITLALGGQIGIGTGPGAVTLELAGGITDFEVPTFVLAQLSPANQGATVTLAELATDFIGMNFNNVPLLNQIGFKELEFYAVAEDVMIDNQQYYPGIGLTGDISFFGYDLDFGFSLVTNPNVAVKAKGTISDNGGPIKITVAGLNVLTFSDSTGNYGPSACIDTSGSGFCGGSAGAGYYFYINAKVSLLGLVSESVVAEASSSSFELDLALDASNIFSERLHVEFIPASNDFAASISTAFTPPNITLGPWGVIPQFTISLPQISLCAALGTIMPQAAPCQDGWMPSSAPYIRFDLTFTWGPIDFSMDVELDFNTISNAFQDFGSWLVSYVLSQPGKILQAILSDAAQLAKLLLWLGKEILALAEWVFDKVVQTIQDVFNYAYQEAAQLVSDAVNAIEQCATEVANDAMSASSGAPLSRTPAFLADFTESPKGQNLLYHYYLQRPELEKICKSNTATGAHCRELLASHRQHPALAEGHPLTFAIDLIQASTPAGSPEFKTSSTEVSAELEKYRNLSYPELLAALRT